MAATSLTAGDVAVVGLNTGQTDGSGQPATVDTIYFVLLHAIGSGTQIFFTDRSWNGTAFGAAGGGEGTFTYSTGVDLPAGTVITITSGQLSAAGITLANAGDNLYVYQGTDANTPTSFLYAVDFADGNTTFNASLTNTGLTNGVNALAVDLDSGAYSGPVTQQDSYHFNGTDLVHAISDPNNWYGDNRDTVNALVQPAQGTFLTSPDIQIWGAAAGGGDGVIRIDADATGGGLGVQLNQVRIYTSDGDEGAAFQNLFVAPRDIVIDTVHGKFFIADSDLAGTNRILQGNLSDLLGSPGTVPTVTVLFSDVTSGVNSQIRNLVIDPEHGQVFFSHGGATSVQRVNYDTPGQTATTIVNLGAGNPNGNSNNFVDDFVINFATGHIYITSHRVTAAADGDILSRNFIYDASGLTTGTAAPLSYTNLPFSPDDTAGGFFQVPGEAFPHELGSLEGIAINAAGTMIYFATATLTEDTDGDGDTGDVVFRPGGIYSYALTGNAAGTYTQIYVQTLGGGGPQGLLDELEIDETSGRYYVTDTTGGTAPPGNEGVWTGLLSGGAPVLLSTVANINSLLLDGFEINRAPTLTVTSSAGTYTETAGVNSGFNTVVQLISAATAADVDTSGFTDQLNGAVVRISNGFLQGATHQDRLTINGTTSGTLDFGSQDISYSYDSTTGVMTLTGASTFANYQAALVLVRYAVSGDNPTLYGTDGTRTISWSISDGLVSSDEQQVSVTVTGVNDNPVNTTGGTATGNEDAATIAITGMSVADPDANPASATITVTLSVAHGTLDIRTDVASGLIAGNVTGDGTNTITITGTQNAINATLANGTGLLYTPAANFNGPDAVHIVTTDGGASGTGGTLGDTDDKAITVTAVNDAPLVVGDGTETLAATNEDVANAALTNTVSALFSGQYSDATDQVSGGSSANALAGVAVTANGSTAGTGQWQYWNGATWVNVGAASTAAAVTLAATTPLRFLPAANFNGPAPTLTVKLVDDSGGALTNGAVVNVSTSGGTTPYSAGTVVLDHGVTAINDAPTVTGSTVVNVVAINEDDTNPVGSPVSSLFTYSDTADQVSGGSSANALAGVAITANAATTEGTWQYFSGGVWQNLPAVSTTSAFFVNVSDSLRFLPAANFNGAAPALTLSLVDDSSGGHVTGATLDLTTVGGSTPYSTALTLSDTVNAVNDAPVAISGDTAAFTEGQGPVLISPNFAASDVDSANLTGATITISDFRTGDVLAFVNQNGISGSYNSGTGVLTLTGSSSVANYQAAIRSITYDGAADANFGGTDNTRTLNYVLTDGTDPSTAGISHVTVADGGGTANDDAVSTNENVVLNGNVESNNGSGADTGVTSVTEVNGVGANVGTQITLASGALLTVNADGTFSYDPNGQFNYLGGPTSGASNLTATDSFTYTVDGGDTATVTVTVNGVDSTGDILQGTGGGDTIDSGTGNDTINGLAGGDTLSGGDGNDIVNGGDDGDTLNGNDGNDKLNGDNGTDTLNGGLGADLIHGGAGNDHLFGGGDNDNLWGDAGNDDMHGGAGNDVYNVEDAGDTVDEAAGEGTDLVREGLANYTLTANVENLEMQGSGDINANGNASNNTMTGTIGNNQLFGFDGNDTLNGLAGKDTLYGGNGNDNINGGDDNDTIDGGADNDQVHGDSGNDIVHGGDGGDTVYGDEGNDKVYGDAGADNIYGGAGADQMFGGDDNDHLYGGTENDTLDGGAGADYMEGGTGNDVYIVDNTGDSAVELSGEGFDIVRNSVNFTLGANVESMELQGSDDISGTGNALVNSITGNSGANLLKGMAGNDTLLGGDGDDTLTGGTGNDQLTGGNGFDTFVVLQESVGNPTLEIDFVYDLNMAGGDRIDLSAIDANSGLAGNQAFAFVASFSHHAGEATLSYDAGAGVTSLRLDVNGDGIADYQMKITGDVTGTATNINTGGEPAGDGGWIL
jgi:Ca2+-binding RTX toxin-like protein